MIAASIASVIAVYGVVFLSLLALYVEKGRRPFRQARRGLRRLPAWEKTFLALFVGVWIAFANIKEGTNGVDQVEGDTNTVTQIEGNTNDEWRRIVCSNVFESVGGAVSFRGDVNANAYYYVEVCAERGPAPIYFNADRTSRLGSPVIVANGGVTNHVPLLIGVEYAVTSTVPISVSFSDEGFTQIEQNDERSYAVKWPLDAVFTEGYSGSNRTYTISFTPYDPGGTLTWDEAPSPRPLLLGASGGPACGCVTCSGNTVTFGCTPNCTCHGDCQAIGGYCYENAIFAITGGVCRCGFDDPVPSPPEAPGEDVATPSFSIGFSSPAVIFEDTYTNSPGDVVVRRSTRVVLSVLASGGTNGGSFELGSLNLGRLVSDDGGDVQLPSGGTLAPHESFSWTCICEGAKASTREGDIEVSGYFIENETGGILSDNKSLTSLRVEVVPDEIFPFEFPNRHIYGVCEKIKLFTLPSSISGIQWGVPDSLVYFDPTENYLPCRFGLQRGDFIFTLMYQNIRFPVITCCLEPNMIIPAGTPQVLNYGGVRNVAGCIGMNVGLVMCPHSVSFRHLRVRERNVNGNASGYFDRPYFYSWWNHSTTQGAERVVEVGPANDFNDIASMIDECPPLTHGGWNDGNIVWNIPSEWLQPSDFYLQTPYHEFCVNRQKFTIDASGTVKVNKFNWTVERNVYGNCHVTQGEE